MQPRTRPAEADRPAPRYQRRGGGRPIVTVDTGGCWIWNWSRHPQDGYGWLAYRFSQNDRGQVMAHRVVWEILRGPIPTDTALDHLCRVPECVNPDHLEPVHRAENCRRGKNAKLDWEAVEIIRGLLAQGRLTHTAIGAMFGVSRTPISNIATGRSWTTPKKDVRFARPTPLYIVEMVRAELDKAGVSINNPAHRSAPAGRPLSPTLPSPLPGDGWGRLGGVR